MKCFLSLLPAACFVLFCLAGCVSPEGGSQALSQSSATSRKRGRTEPSSRRPEFSENSLNVYNSHWDDFGGALELGKTYYYTNRGFPRELQFRFLQKIGEHQVLFMRVAASGPVDGEERDLCDTVTFLVLTDKLYADGVALREGEYVCTGTYQYETEAQTRKTVYVLTEKGFSPGK